MVAKWLVLARIFLDSGAENVAGGPVTHPARSYQGRVLQWGTIDRSVPTPTGLPHVGDARVRLADTDRRWRSLLARQTPRRRTCELKLVREETSESAVPVLYSGQVVDVEFGPGYAELTLRDHTFSWLDEEIPGFINRTNFPALGEGIDEAFLPIIAGICQSDPANPTGVIALPHIGWDDVLGDRYGLAAHPVWDVTAVYRLEDVGIGAAVEASWVLVNPAEYNITLEERTFVEVPDLVFHPTFLDFLVEQPPGARIRADIEGMDFRGGWEGLPAAGYDPDLNPSGTPGALRNPIDVFINIIYLVLHKAGTDAAAWNIDSFATLLQRFGVPAGSAGAGFGAELGEMELGGSELGGSETYVPPPYPPFYCDGALVEPMTTRSFLSRFLASFQLDMYQQKDGRIALAYTDETDPGRPVFNETAHILRDSFYERLASPTVNRARYRYHVNYATEEWATQQIFDNMDDQDALGTDIAPRREDDVFDLWWVRDSVTALYVTTRRMSFLALGSYRQSWTMPLPEVLEDIELTRLVGVTHGAGADVDGYANKEVKIVAMAIDLDRLTVTLDSILRIPQELQRVSGVHGIAELQGAGTLEAVGTVVGPPPPEGNLLFPFEMLAAYCSSSNSAVMTFLRSQTYLDTAEFDEVLNYHFEIVATNANATTAYDASLVDEAGNVLATHTVAANTGAAATRHRATFTPVTGVQRYRLRVAQSASVSQVIVYAARILIEVSSALTKGVVQIPLITNPNTGDPADITTTNYVDRSVNSTVYALENGDRHTWWQRDNAKMSTISKVRLEAAFRPALATTATVGLVNKTAGDLEVVAVTGSVATGGQCLTAEALGSAVNFDDGDEFCTKFKATASNCLVHKVAIYLVLAPITAFEVWHRFAEFGPTAAATTNDKHRALPGLTYAAAAYVETTGRESTAGTVTLVARDDGTNDSGVTGANIAASAIDFDSTTQARVRTGDILGSLVQGNRLIGRVERTSGTLVAPAVYLVVKAGAAP